jgi:hypothetical protein
VLFNLSNDCRGRRLSRPKSRDDSPNVLSLCQSVSFQCLRDPRQETIVLTTCAEHGTFHGRIRHCVDASYVRHVAPHKDGAVYIQLGRRSEDGH